MTDQTPRQDVPAIIFVIVIALCLLGGGAFVYYWFSGASPLGAQITLKEGQDLERERGGPPRQSGIRLQRADDSQRVYQVQAGRNQMMVIDRKDGPDLFEVRLRRLLSGEAAQLGRAAMRIAGDNQVARLVNVTDAQRQQLRDLQFDRLLMQGTPAELSGEEKAKLSAAWNEADVWNRQALAPAAERKIIQAMEQVMESSRDRTRASLTQQTEKVKQILSAEQIAAFNRMGDGGGAGRGRRGGDGGDRPARNRQAAPAPAPTAAPAPTK